MDLARIDVETGRGQVLRSYYDENEYEQSNDRKNDELFAYYIVKTARGCWALTPNQWHGDEPLPEELV